MIDKLAYDHYFAYEELTNHIHQLAARRPDLARAESIGKSYEDRDIWCVTITNSLTGPAEDKPAFWIDGNIHATELSASSACIRFIEKLVSDYGVDPEVTRVLDTRAYYIVPRVNPDGAELYFSDKPRYIRSSVRPYPHDEEGLEGLTPEDMDGNGKILTMRILDPNGPWKVHPEEPRLMIRRDPIEIGGKYYRLLPEGKIENWDGELIKMKPRKEGLDLNRNFPAHWRQEVDQHGAGPYPTSEPEVKAIVDFIASHRNITGGVAFHTFAGLLLRPYGTQNDETFPAEDLWTYQKIGAKGTELTGYPNISVFHEFRYHPKEVITGVSDDWMYDHMGVFAWTVEIWSPQKQAGITEYKYIDWYREHPVEDDFKMFKWNDEKLGGKGFVDWQPFDHPQLGTIEIGGWDGNYCFRNPPPDFLASEVDIFPRWLLWHALISPLLAIRTFEAVPLGEGAYRIRLVVENDGWLPTYVTKKAVERKVTRGVVAELELPVGAALRVGKQREEMGQLEGKAYTDTATSAWLSDTTEDRAKTEWVVTGEPGQTIIVRVHHDRAGARRIELTLP